MVNRYKINKTVLTAFIVFALTSCFGDKPNTTDQSLALDFDSVSVKLKYSETLFVIPSPDQTTALLKKCHIGFRQNILASKINPEAYTTTLKKALILGVTGADLSYLNLYSQKELASKYLGNLQMLMNDLDLTQYLDLKTVDKLSDNFGNHDSVLYYISGLFKQCDRFLKLNDRRDIGALIIAGGWIESFYFLTELYSETKSAQLHELILYQKDILNNLVKIISPFYEKTTEYKELIDDMINLAYEFDVVDKTSKINSILTDTVARKTTINNETQYMLTGSKLDGIITSIRNLRNKLIS
jgi:hypothetical protein